MSAGHLQNWLSQATRDLPDAVITDLHDELHAHYDDAYRDYLLAGLSPDAAAQRAITDLGDPAMANDSFIITYHPEHYYKRAALASIAAPGSLVLTFPFAILLSVKGHTPIGYAAAIAFPVMLCMLSWWAADMIPRALRCLLGVLAPLDTPVRLIRWGTLAMIALSLLMILPGLLSPRTSSVLMINDPLVVLDTVSRTTPLTLHRMLFALWAGIGCTMVGTGWLLLAMQLESGGLYGLYAVLRLFAFLSGVGLLGTGAALLMYDPPLAMALVGFLSIITAIRSGILTLLFFRASRSPVPYLYA